MEDVVNAYIHREVECILQSIHLEKDPILFSLRQQLLSLVCTCSHLDFYQPMLEEAEKRYNDELTRQRNRHTSTSKAAKEYWMYDDVLRVLEFTKEDIRQRMEEPLDGFLSEWRTKQCAVLEETTEPHQRSSVCLKYAYCKHNRSDFMCCVTLYQERRNEYEKTGKAYPSIEWLSEYEKQLFPWGIPEAFSTK